MREFLDFVMLPGGYVEVRAIKHVRVRQWWERDREAAVDLAMKLSDDGWDAYYGVLPRRIHGDGSTAAIPPFTRTLWADLDDKIHGDKSRTLMALVRFPVPPSVVVDSGHGYHAYWRLDSIVPFDQGKRIMVGLAEKLKGDHVYDAARILRLPGTVNYKDPQAPVPVRAVVFDTTCIYRAADLHAYEYLGALKLQPPAPRPRAYVPAERRADLPDWLADLIRDGAPQGQRSEAAWKVMCALIDRGWSDDEIRTAFDGGGIGEKMRELRDGGERWFNRSMTRARARA